jgi:DNA-binding LacI/PurR family transcriptional regulator
LNRRTTGWPKATTWWGGLSACQQLLARGIDFTALFASNDDMAIGAMRALREAGRQIPEQVSLFGFDDEPAAAYLSPALSTVHIPIERMSEQAIQQALRLATGAELAALRLSPVNCDCVSRCAAMSHRLVRIGIWHEQ